MLALSDITTSSLGSSLGGGYVFPVLPVTEILTCLDELGISAQKNELEEPMRHKERLKQIFLALIETCCGKTEDDMDAPRARAYALEHYGTASTASDNHNDDDGGGGGSSSPVAGGGGLHGASHYGDIRFFQVLMQLCYEGGCDCALRDLLHPTPIRLREQLSAIINLAKFREEQLQVYAQLSEPRSIVYPNIEDALAERQGLRDDEANVEANVALVRGDMESLDRECQQVELDIAQFNQVQTSIRQEADLLKKQATDLKHKVDTTSWALHECTVELEHWKGQVVRSPERKLAAVEQKTLLLDAAKAELAALEQARGHTKQGKRAHQVLVRDLQDLQFDVLTELADAAQHASTQLREHQATTSSVEHQIHFEEAEVLHAEREHHRFTEHSAAEKKRFELQLAAAHETHDVVTAQLLRLEKERREAMLRTEQGEREIRSLELLMDEEQDKAEQEIQHMIEQYRIVERQFLERDNARLQALGIVKGE